MGFVQAVQSGFKNYTNFSGRASRSEAAYWLLFSLLVGICTGIVDTAIGWNILWALTIVGIFFPLIYWTYFKPGDEGGNEYGPNPLSDQREGDVDLSQDNFVTDSDQQDAGSGAEHK